MFSSTSPWIDCCKDCCLAHGRGWEKIGPQRGAFIVVSMGNFRHWRSRAKSSRSHFSLWSHWIIFWWKWRSRWGKDRARVNIFLKIPIAIFFPRTIPEPSSSGLEHLVSEMKAFEKEQRFFFSLYFLVNNNYCSERKKLKTGEDSSYVLPTPVASLNKIQGIISLSQLFCLALGWHFQINIFVIITIIHWPKLNFQTQKKLISYRIFSVYQKIQRLYIWLWWYGCLASLYPTTN